MSPTAEVLAGIEPGGASKGAFYFDSEEGTVKFHDGSRFVAAGRAIAQVRLGQAVGKGQAIGRSTVEHVAAAGGVTSGDATTVVCAVPTGSLRNQVMVAAIGWLGDETYTVTAPTGWTLWKTFYNATSAHHVSVFTKPVTVADESLPSYTWTFSITTRGSAVIDTFEGVDQFEPVHTGNGVSTVSGTAHSTPPLTTTVAKTMLVAIFGFDASANTVTPPSSFTEPSNGDQVSTGAGNDITVEVSYLKLAAAGTSAARSGTSSGTADGIAIQLALQPAYKLAANNTVTPRPALGFALRDGNAGEIIPITDRITRKAATAAPGTLIYLAAKGATAGEFTTTRPTAVTGVMKQNCGYYLTDDTVQLVARGFREVTVPLVLQEYSGGEGALAARIALDSGLYEGLQTNAQNEYVLWLARLPENFVEVVRANYWSSQDGAGSPTFTYTVGSALPGTSHDAVTADSSETSKAIGANGADDLIDEYNFTGALDATSVALPGALLAIQVKQSDAGTVAVLHFGGELVVKVAE